MPLEEQAVVGRRQEGNRACRELRLHVIVMLVAAVRAGVQRGHLNWPALAHKGRELPSCLLHGQSRSYVHREADVSRWL